MKHSTITKIKNEIKLISEALLKDDLNIFPKPRNPADDELFDKLTAHLAGLKDGTIKQSDDADGHFSVPPIEGLWPDLFKKITNITIPEGFTEIGPDAFKKAPKLKSVTMPDTIVNVHSAAFSECENLDNVKFGTKKSEIEMIEGDAFDESELLWSDPNSDEGPEGGVYFKGLSREEVQNIAAFKSWSRSSELVDDEHERYLTLNIENFY